MVQLYQMLHQHYHHVLLLQQQQQQHIKEEEQQQTQKQSQKQTWNVQLKEVQQKHVQQELQPQHQKLKQQQFQQQQQNFISEEKHELHLPKQNLQGKIIFSQQQQNQQHDTKHQTYNEQYCGQQNYATNQHKLYQHDQQQIIPQQQHLDQHFLLLQHQLLLQNQLKHYQQTHHHYHHYPPQHSNPLMQQLLDLNLMLNLEAIQQQQQNQQKQEQQQKPYDQQHQLKQYQQQQKLQQSHQYIPLSSCIPHHKHLHNTSPPTFPSQSPFPDSTPPWSKLEHRLIDIKDTPTHLINIQNSAFHSSLKHPSLHPCLKTQTKIKPTKLQPKTPNQPSKKLQKTHLLDTPKKTHPFLELSPITTKEHKKRNKQETDKNLTTCYACARTFSSRGSLRYHLTRCHVVHSFKYCPKFM